MAKTLTKLLLSMMLCLNPAFSGVYAENEPETPEPTELSAETVPAETDGEDNTEEPISDTELSTEESDPGFPAETIITEDIAEEETEPEETMPEEADPEPVPEETVSEPETEENELPAEPADPEITAPETTDISEEPVNEEELISEELAVPENETSETVPAESESAEPEETDETVIITEEEETGQEEENPESVEIFEEDEGIEDPALLNGTNYTLTVTYGQREARDMLTKINSFRTGSDAWYWNDTNTKKISASGLKTLTYDYGLEKIAMQRAAEIAVRFSHTRPNGGKSTTAYGVLKTPTGENIAYGYNSAAEVFNAWREDNENYDGQGHRRNMLDSRFKYVGIGHVVYQGFHYWVQEFNGNVYSTSWTAANTSETPVTIEIDGSIISSSSYAADDDLPYSVDKGSTISLPAIRESLTVTGHLPSYRNVLAGTVNAAWTSGNTAVATISNGKLTGKGAGTATITARVGSWSKQWTVEVITRPEKVTLNKTSLSLSSGDQVSLKATVLPSDAKSKEVYWTSSNSEVAAVNPKNIYDSSNATVVALNPGTATITVKTNDGGKAATCTVTVTRSIRVTGIYLNKDYVNRVYGTDIVSIYDIWYEDHTDCQPDVKCLYRQINWQGRVNGIAADVDLDVYVGIHTAGTQTEGDNMSKKEKFIQALKKNGDGRYHYWDGSTMGIGCSEYTRICLVEAGVIKEGETFHAGSGNVGVLADTKRFMRLPWNPNTLQEADIQWSNYHHVNTWDGARGVYEAAPESTHGPKSWNVCDNGKTGVGHWSNHGYYNCGTGTNDWDCIYRIIEDGNQTVKTGKILSKAYVQGALALLDRRLAYENSYPYNCGLLDEKGVTWGDCWNINPKTTVWSMILGEPIWANQVKGEAHVRHIYSDGIKASGLPDCTGDVIMDKYCTGTTFRQMVSTPKAPCFLLINGQHMGAYLGEFVRDGKTYNVTEFSPNPNLNGKMRSYVDEYGQRWTCKGGTVIGAWNCCGYLTTYIDYSDWDDPQPAPQPTPVPDKTVDTLAQEIYAGKWGINPGRKASITAQYGAAMYDAAQKRDRSETGGRDLAG